MNSTAIRRNDLLARAAELGYPPVVCNAVVLANPAAWHARMAAAFDLELDGVAVQLDRLEAVAAARAREVEVESGTAFVPMQSASEYAEMLRERERRAAHAEAEFARRERALKSKQLDDAGIE